MKHRQHFFSKVGKGWGDKMGLGCIQNFSVKTIFLCNSEETGFLSNCPSLMLGIALRCIQHIQAMLEREVCEFAHSFFHLYFYHCFILMGCCYLYLPMIPENPEINASYVFRTQLMTPHTRCRWLPRTQGKLRPQQCPPCQ